MGAPVASNNGPDVRILDGGSVLLFLPLTPDARAWVAAHVSEARQMLGMGLAVEPRYAAALTAGMELAGLAVEHDARVDEDTDRHRSPVVERIREGSHATDDPAEAHQEPSPVDSATSNYVQAVIRTPRLSPTSDRYDLGGLFLCWAWEVGYRDWHGALRVLARVLRGLERIGLIERRTIRRAGHPTHHGFELTREGREAVFALSGAWINEEDQ